MSACLFLNNLLPRSFCRNVSFLEHLESDISIQLTVLMWPHNLSVEIKQSWAARCQCQWYLPQQVFMYILEIMFCWLWWWFRWYNDVRPVRSGSRWSLYWRAHVAYVHHLRSGITGRTLHWIHTRIIVRMFYLHDGKTSWQHSDVLFRYSVLSSSPHTSGLSGTF